jgi:hypothetical protein
VKLSLFIAASLLFYPGLLAQVAPSATGAASNFNYALRYSQSAQFGGSYGDWQTASPSGEVDYTSGSTTAPLNLRYVGGHTSTLAGPAYSAGWFQRLSLEQSLAGRKWNAMLSDDVRYAPQAPVTGFSGIPGTGEPIGTPTPSPSDQSVLTLGTYALTNDATAEVSRALTRVYSVTASGTYNLLRYPDSNGLDSDTAVAHGLLTRRLNARNSVSGQYGYTRSAYPDTSFAFYTNSAMGIYDRDWSRSLHTSIALGPEWISSSLPQLVPASTMLAVNATLNRELRRGSLSLTYNRDTSGGSGYLLGEEHDSISGGYSRDLERKFTIDIAGGYRRSTPLSQRGIIESESCGIQLFRHFGPHLSAFVNYTLIAQSANLALPSNVVQQPLHMISFGTTFEPRNRNRR